MTALGDLVTTTSGIRAVVVALRATGEELLPLDRGQVGGQIEIVRPAPLSIRAGPGQLGCVVDPLGEVLGGTRAAVESVRAVFRTEQGARADERHERFFTGLLVFDLVARRRAGSAFAVTGSSAQRRSLVLRRIASFHASTGGVVVWCHPAGHWVEPDPSIVSVATPNTATPAMVGLAPWSAGAIGAQLCAAGQRALVVLESIPLEAFVHWQPFVGASPLSQLGQIAGFAGVRPDRGSLTVLASIPIDAPRGALGFFDGVFDAERAWSGAAPVSTKLLHAPVRVEQAATLLGPIAGALLWAEQIEADVPQHMLAEYPPAMRSGLALRHALRVRSELDADPIEQLCALAALAGLPDEQRLACADDLVPRLVRELRAEHSDLVDEVRAGVLSMTARERLAAIAQRLTAAQSTS